MEALHSQADRTTQPLDLEQHLSLWHGGHKEKIASMVELGVTHEPNSIGSVTKVDLFPACH
jgi:hypothetical protein